MRGPTDIVFCQGFSSKQPLKKGKKQRNRGNTPVLKFHAPRREINFVVLTYQYETSS